MFNRTNKLLAVLLAAVLAAVLLLRVDHSRPNIEVLPEMKYSPAADAFAANALLPGGRTMQLPPAGTIPRGQMPLRYAASKTDALRAGRELLNPFPAISERSSSEKNANGKQNNARNQDDVDAAREAHRRSVARGRRVFQVFCRSCHGPGGAGDGPVAQRGFPPPPSLLTGKSRQMKDGQLFHILTYGQQSMSPMAGQLSRERRWDAINFVRDLQSRAPKTPPKPATARQPNTPNKRP